MTLAAKELALQRQNTLAFIAADPVVLALTPRADVALPSGGTTTEDQAPRALQTFRLIPQNSTTPSARSSSGRGGSDTSVTRKFPFVLLGAHDAVFAVHDWWEDGQGRRWMIDQIHPSPPYERRALVTQWKEF